MTHKGKRIYKKVTYKAVHFDKSPGAGVTLASLLTKALVQLATVGDRRRNIGSEDDPVFHVIGTPVNEPSGVSFGTLMTYTPGTDPLFLVDDVKAQDVLLEKLPAPSTDDGKRREFLESILFFVAYKNHVALIQSQALKAVQLESYLLWMLHASKALAGDTVLRLIDTPPKAVRKKMEAGGGVKRITLGGEVVAPPLTTPTVTMPPGRVATGSQMVVSSAPVSQTSSVDLDEGGMVAALKKLLKPADIAKIPFEDLADSNIEMFVTLRYNRKTTEAGQKLMDSLGVALRHADDVETELTLKEGGSIKGGELRLTGTLSLQSYDGQLSHSEVFQELQKWLLARIEAEGL
ncbi:hypothetical protein [Comamonas odontotermitis]|uniref:hypothetical protein n=1 Tax=Comamonas odontotermitis TaxID=379895 RepID=UPI00375369BB